MIDVKFKVELMASFKQKKAQLAKNRDHLMDLVSNAKLNRANEVKVYKDFASVVTFLDKEDEGEASWLDSVPVLTKKVVNEKPDSIKTNIASAKNVNIKQQNQPEIEPLVLILEEEETAEMVSSGYWDKKFQ